CSESERGIPEPKIQREEDSGDDGERPDAPAQPAGCLCGATLARLATREWNRQRHRRDGHAVERRDRSRDAYRQLDEDRREGNADDAERKYTVDARSR